jgi:pimeloyl-ACP methyl ester carboxylesterase
VTATIASTSNRATLVERVAVYGDVRTRELRQSGKGPPIVLLHGFTDSADTWRPLMRELKAKDRAVTAYDLPHFGAAERPPFGEALLPIFDKFAADVVRDADRGEGVILAGSSLGGLVALRAAQDPDLAIRAVIAIGPAGFGLQPWVGAIRKTAFLVGAISRAPVPHAVARRALGEAYAQLCVRKPLDVDVKARYASHLDPGDLGRILRLGGRVLAEVTAADVLNLQAISAPVTLVWGRYDALCPCAGSERAEQSPLVTVGPKDVLERNARDLGGDAVVVNTEFGSGPPPSREVKVVEPDDAAEAISARSSGPGSRSKSRARSGAPQGDGGSASSRAGTRRPGPKA